MLWYKGWLETRSRVLRMVLIALVPIQFITLAAHGRNPASVGSPSEVRNVIEFLALYYSMIPLMLAGSGIKTQAAASRWTKGLHASIYFTLSLPVSRARRLATRSGLGMAEAGGVLAIAFWTVWIANPYLRTFITASDMFECWVSFFVFASAVYFLGVLLSTFLEEVSQTWASTFGVVLLWAFSKACPNTPASIFGPMGVTSPLFTHTLPWASMGVTLGVAAILFWAAQRVVESREY